MNVMIDELHKKTILITDDSEFNRELLTEILGDEYEYLYAEDGKQAIFLLSEGYKIDLMLLDIHMPKMDGMEVLRIMGQSQWVEKIPTVVISADNDEEVISKASQLGAVDYITRPFTAFFVQHRVKNTLLMYENQKKNITSLLDNILGDMQQTDLLTHIPFRAYMDRYAAKFEKAKGIAMIDVNDFKQVNDRYGHLFGDAALDHIVSVVRSCIRREDMLVRYGGDEFMLFFWDIAEGDFFRKLQMIKQCVTEHPLDGKTLHISIGGAYGALSLKEAIDIADKAMYADKEQSKKKGQKV